MNREYMKQLFPVMQAFIEGKKIQTKPYDSYIWVDTVDPNWDAEVNYRVKPEKVERWLWKSPVHTDDSSDIAYVCKAMAVKTQEKFGGTITHLVEAD